MRKGFERERRRKVWTGGAAQRAHVARLVRLPTIVLILIAALVGWLVVRGLDGKGLVRHDAWSILLGALVLLVAGIGLIWTEAIRASSKVSGPEHHLCETIARIRSGDLGQRVRLRDGDALQALATELNALLDWLETHPPQPRESVLVAGAEQRGAG